MSRKKLKTFDQMHDEIDSLLNKRRSKWKLLALAWLDFDDVKQIIKLHIHKKWKMWDQARPLGPWLNRLVSNQIRNIIRNQYTTYVKPCASCKYNLNKISSEATNEYSCEWTPSKTQCSECPLYAKWERNKKDAFNLKIPVTIENHKNYCANIEEVEPINLNLGEAKLHALMKEELSPKHFFIYKMFFIDCLSDEQIAKFLKFRTSEKGRTAGYRQIHNLKRLFYLRAKQMLEEKDVFDE